jgi:hypothetical protein
LWLKSSFHTGYYRWSLNHWKTITAVHTSSFVIHFELILFPFWVFCQVPVVWSLSGVFLRLERKIFSPGFGYTFGCEFQDTWRVIADNPKLYCCSVHMWVGETDNGFLDFTHLHMGKGWIAAFQDKGREVFFGSSTSWWPQFFVSRALLVLPFSR